MSRTAPSEVDAFPTRRVLIVGGGSSGWMTAAYLQAALRDDPRGKVEITVIESPTIPRISVGEATVPSIRHFLSVTDVHHLDFMRATDATFKQSIKYVNWLHKERHFYHHPFSRNRQAPLDRAAIDWVRSDRSIPFMETVSVQPLICDAGLAPLMLGPWDFGAPLTYAFHMNAQKFADYCRDLCVKRGVVHVADDVVDVALGNQGQISSVATASGRVLHADLFIDCSGFSALLSEKALNVAWEDCSQWLLCDRAIAMHIPYDCFYPGHVRPYTTATALSSGWVWDIPLTNCRSIGYVHASAYLSEDAAEAEVRQYAGAAAAQLPSRVVRFKVGRREKVWFKNCIAIGLSGGFIEPLESTGLFLSQQAAELLAEHFPFCDEDQEHMAFRVNRIMGNRFYEILDFINMHYCLTRRTDTSFWREVQKPERIVPRLRAKLEYWKAKSPSVSDFEDQFMPGQASTLAGPSVADSHPRGFVDTGHLWAHESYECILYGMDFMGEEYKAKLGDKRMPPVVSEAVMQRLLEAPSKLPPHDVWLQTVLGMKKYVAVLNSHWCSHD